jgi:wyosine [tRNA(Phe)-imidazoG37] synthetase (radical SAM superfamily)
MSILEKSDATSHFFILNLDSILCVVDIVMTYTYGPVASWRYGRSLGVDITTPPKKCTFNCVYCQLGPTKKHVVTPEDIQDDLPLPEEIYRDVGETLGRLDKKTVDVITFSGTGEPTLNPSIGLIESKIRDVVEDLPIILLTNASLLPRKEVRKRLENFDIITAKYDAGDKDTFRRINHPAKGTFNLEEIQNGIKQLHGEMKGILALEVMLLRGARGLTNVDGPPRKALIDGILDVNPDLVQIYTPWRPSAVKTVKPVTNKTLVDFGRELGDCLGDDRLWVYGVHDAREKGVGWNTHHRLEKDLLGLLRRRPCRMSDIQLSLGLQLSTVTTILEKLQISGKVKKTMVDQDTFYDVTTR